MKCKKCGSNKLILDPYRGEIFCSECGLVNERVHVHNYKDVKPTFFLGAYTTFSNPRYNSISRIIYADVIRYGNGKYQKGRAYALNEILRINAVLNLPSLTRFQSIDLYEKAIAETNILMDKRITLESMATAVVMLAMEILDMERPFDEILAASKANKRAIEITFKKLKKWYLSRESSKRSGYNKR